MILIKGGKTNRFLRLMKNPWITDLWDSTSGHPNVLFRVYSLYIATKWFSLDNMGSLWGYILASPITVSVPHYHRFLPFNTEHSPFYYKIKVRVKTKEFHKNNNRLVPHNLSLPHNLPKGKKNARRDLGLNGNWLNFFFSSFNAIFFKLLVSSDLSNTE